MVEVPVTTAFASDDDGLSKGRRGKIAPAVAALALAVAGVGQTLTLRSLVDRDARRQAVLNAHMATLDTGDRGAVLVWMCCGMEPEYWDSRKASAPKFALCVCDWPTFSPRYYRLFEERVAAGRAVQLLPAMVDNRRALLVSSQQSA